jgi:hypothetical protein
VLGERVSTFGQTDAVGRILVQTDFLFAGGDVSLVADLLACNQGKPGQQCSGNVKASVEIERLAP